VFYERIGYKMTLKVAGFSFQTHLIHQRLKPFIKKIWTFENTEKMPDSHLNLIAPNGEIKMIISYRKGMRSTIGNTIRDHQENRCFIIGLHTTSGTMDWEANYGSIGIEFQPFAAYRFFKFPLIEIKNNIYNISDLLNRSGAELEEQIAEIEAVSGKVAFVQKFLAMQLRVSAAADSVVEFAVNRIISASGLIRFAALSDEIGYSTRQLNRRFTEVVGLNPKEFTNIIRFDRIFRNMKTEDFVENEFYDSYYDQSHFVKHFKSVTGITPKKYLKSTNVAAAIFYSGR